MAQLKYSTTITVSGAIEATILHAIRVLNAPRTLITDFQSEVINLQNNAWIHMETSEPGGYAEVISFLSRDHQAMVEHSNWGTNENITRIANAVHVGL